MKRSNLNSVRSPILRAFVFSLAVITATACNKKDDAPSNPAPPTKQETPREKKSGDSSNNGKSANTETPTKLETSANPPKALDSAPSIVPTEPGSAGAPSTEPATQAEKDAAKATEQVQTQASKEAEIKRKLDESNAAPANRDELLKAMGTQTPLTVMLADYLSSNVEDSGDGALQVISTTLEGGVDYAPARIAEVHGDLERLIKAGLFKGSVINRAALLNETLETRIDRLEYRDVLRARRGFLYIALVSGAFGVIVGSKGLPALKEEADRLITAAPIKAMSAATSAVAVGATAKTSALDFLLNGAPKIANDVSDSALPTGKAIIARTWGATKAATSVSGEVLATTATPVKLVVRKLVKVLNIPAPDVEGDVTMGLRAVTTSDLGNLQFNESRLPGLTYTVTKQTLNYEAMAEGNVKIVLKYQPILTKDSIYALVSTREMDMKTAEYYVAKFMKRPGASEEFATRLEADGLYSTELPADKVDLSDIVDKPIIQALNPSAEVAPMIDTAALKLRASQIKNKVIHKSLATIKAVGDADAKVLAKAKSLLIPDIANFNVRWATIGAGSMYGLLKGAMWYQADMDAKSNANLSDLRDSLIPTAAVPDADAATPATDEQGN